MMIKQCFNDNWTWVKGAGTGLDSLLGGGATPAPVTLPHDASIGEKRVPDLHMGPGVGNYPYQNLVYSKEFELGENPEGTVVWLEFEGVYMNAAVYINNSFAGKCAYGYSNFYIDATRFVRFGQKNKIRVIVKNGVASGRWYTGSGIYRDVKLIVGLPVHIQPDGVQIATPEVEKELAVVRVTTKLANNTLVNKEVVVRHEVRNATGAVVADACAPVTLFAGETKPLRLSVAIENPDLWDVETPNLYTCHTTILADGQPVDEETNRFGVRKLQLDAVNGLRINGRQAKLRGGCIHHDHGVIGAMEFKTAELRRVKKLKDAGYNAVRMSHHPSSRALLEACDELGMLMMEEFSDCWSSCKVDFDYGFHFTEWWEHDVTRMVEKAYNHPSVILYSIGNEIPETGDAVDVQWGKKLADKVRELDDTRYTVNCVNLLLSAMRNAEELMKSMAQEGQPVEINSAMNNMMALAAQAIKSKAAGKMTEECFAQVDIAGYNYATARYAQDLEEYPNRIIVGSETFVSQLDENWGLVQNNPRLIGDFCWTAWDYLGEAGIGGIDHGEQTGGGFYRGYPWKSAYVGDLDMLGDRRPVSYWRDIVWGTRTEPYIAVQDPTHYGEKQTPSKWGWSDAQESWTWRGFEGKPVVVEVYANADEVELVLNGKPVGRKGVGEDKACVARFDTVYHPGKLEAVAYADGKECSRFALHTAAEDVSLNLYCDAVNRTLKPGEIAFVELTVADKSGEAEPQRDVTVTISEGGEHVLGFGSANPNTEDEFFSSTSTTFHGRAMAVVRAGNQPGEMKIAFQSDVGNAEVALAVE